jgi:hypothetical protein
VFGRSIMFFDFNGACLSMMLITGDLNFHLDNVNLSDTRKFDETLSDHGLVQHVQGATHNKGHTLKLRSPVISNSSGMTTRWSRNSDHSSKNVVFFNLFVRDGGGR